MHEEAEILGLRIFGLSWVGWHSPEYPEPVGWRKPGYAMLYDAAGAPAAHRYGEIPKGVDIVMTHGPPFEIFDCVGNQRSWGSSGELRNAIFQQAPRVHLFGHLHEQRGVWRRQPDGQFTGGVEYMLHDGFFETIGPPPKGYPCDLVCNTAMQNHPKLEGVQQKRLAGLPRVITAERSEGEAWTFRTP